MILDTSKGKEARTADRVSDEPPTLTKKGEKKRTTGEQMDQGRLDSI